MEQGLQKVNQRSRLMEWSRRVEACRNSGQQVSEWCEGHGIPVSTYYNWQRKALQAMSSENEVCFAEVPVRPENAAIAASIQCGDTSDTIRAFNTAKLVLKENVQPTREIYQDIRLREWCLGTMEAEKNKAFIERVSGWLGGAVSFSEMNRRLPEVAAAIQQHDITGITESFEQIGERLKALLLSVGSSYPNGSNILIVTHAFLIKTIIYLFDFENIDKISKINNTDSIRLVFDGKVFKVM